MCWYCRWGWSVPVATIYCEALDRLDDYEHPLHYGPAHVVWDDENFSHDVVQRCLDDFEKYTREFSDEHMEVVRWSLRELMALPEEDLDIAPWNDEGEAAYDQPPDRQTIELVHGERKAWREYFPGEQKRDH